MNVFWFYIGILYHLNWKFKPWRMIKYTFSFEIWAADDSATQLFAIGKWNVNGVTIRYESKKRTIIADIRTLLVAERENTTFCCFAIFKNLHKRKTTMDSHQNSSIVHVGEYEYNTRDLIGHGAFAVVFKGRHRRVSLIIVIFVYRSTCAWFVCAYSSASV